MGADPFDLRCRRCGTPIDLPGTATADDEFCGPACKTAGPRRHPFAWLADRARRILHRTITTTLVDGPLTAIGYGDPLAWTLRLSDVQRHEEATVRDWLALHGVRLHQIADQRGLLEVCLGPRGAYLCVCLDDGEHQTRLVMAPPAIAGAVTHRPLQADDIPGGRA